jgi:hypothetical protein
MSDKRKHIPLLLLGSAGALGFAVWNIHRSLAPPLTKITKQLDLVAITAQPIDVPPELPGDSHATPGVAVRDAVPVAEELLAPNADPFRPLRAPDPSLRTVVSTLTPRPISPAAFPTGPLNLNGSPSRSSNQVTYALPVAPAAPASRPAVRIQPASVSAPTLPSADRTAAAAAPKVTIVPVVPVAAPEPPTVVGTLLGDEPGAVFEQDGTTEIVTEGAMIGEWTVLVIELDHVTLKHLATGKKIRVAVKSSGISSGQD